MEIHHGCLPGSDTHDIDTPALLINLDVMEQNIETASRFFRGVDASLRPHSKTNKCPPIARKQIAAGAIGVCCAKVGEAEAMVDGGVDNILIANQIVGRTKISRLMSLACRAELIVAVDDAQNVTDLSEAAVAFGAECGVILEVDVGMSRCGVPGGADESDAAVALAQTVEKSPGLRFRGMMGYEGHMVNTTPFEDRRRGTEEAMARLIETRDAVAAAGLPVEIVSAGGTGTYNITGAYSGVTEVEAGSYVFMDGAYRKVLDDFDCALTVLTTVISRPVPGRAILDIGRKSVSNDVGLPEVFGLDGATLVGLSEEHAKLEVSGDAEQLRPGDKIEILPSHGDTTINMHTHYYGTRNGRLEVIWEIAGRGRFR